MSVTYQDLTPLLCKGTIEIPTILRVGWLGAKYPFSQGKIESKYIKRLQEIIINDYTVLKMRGALHCELCNKLGVNVEINGASYPVATSEIWIPTKMGLMYVAPTLIYHHIVTHSYSPPQQFLDALLEVKFPSNWSDEFVLGEISRRCP